MFDNRYSFNKVQQLKKQPEILGNILHSGHLHSVNCANKILFITIYVFIWYILSKNVDSGNYSQGTPAYKSPIAFKLSWEKLFSFLLDDRRCLSS